jgi:hypothetical protein
MTKAGDYEKIAAKLGETNKIPLHSGRTGLLSALSVQSDKYLRRLYLTTYGYTPVPLTQVLFSTKELGEHATILLSTPPATMYVTFGPARDPMSATAMDLTGQIMLIARVVAVEKNAPPTDVGVACPGHPPAVPDAKSQSFSVEEQVVNDVKALAAWDATKSKAEEFMALATKDGWDKAVAQFNKLYGKQAKADPNDPNVFRVDNQVGLQRLSKADLEVLTAQVSNSPASQIVLNQAANEGMFVDRLRALIPAKSDAPAQMPMLVDFKPNQAYSSSKVGLQRLTQEEFQKMKGMLVRREYSQVGSLMAVHFTPKHRQAHELPVRRAGGAGGRRRNQAAVQGSVVMAQSWKDNHALFLISTGALAWLVPGAGHFVLEERRRAVVIFVAIALTFWWACTWVQWAYRPVHARPYYAEDELAAGHDPRAHQHRQLPRLRPGQRIEQIYRASPDC